MKLPLEIAVRGPTLPPGVKEEVEAHAARLNRFYDRIMRSRVTLEARGHRAGRPAWTLRVVLTVPDGTIIVNRQKGENLPEALRETFDAATRRLEDYVRRRRGQVKVHAAKG